MACRPLLRPGCSLLRRDESHLQVGPVVVRDRPGLSDWLLSLDGRGESADPFGLLTPLIEAGAIVDIDGWPGGVPRDELHHAALEGLDPRDLAARRHLRIAVLGAPHDMASQLRDLLADCGVRADPDATTAVILTRGEPSRVALDAYVDAGIDHLPVAVDGNVVHIGPLVRPGSSPCMRCHDAHRSRWDRHWPALVSQFGSAPVTEGALGALARHAAVGFIVSDLVALAEGRPAESATSRITLTVTGRHDLRVPFAPGCRCHLF